MLLSVLPKKYHSIRCYTVTREMKSLSEVFPRASKAFLEANSIPTPLTDAINSVQPIVATRSPYSKKMLMNKTESEYAQILEIQKKRGENQRWEYEGITLKWAGMRYTPDFVVFYRDIAGFQPRLKFIEVKGGHIWDRDIVRFKGARAFYPEFQFEMWQKKKGEWKRLH